MDEEYAADCVGHGPRGMNAEGRDAVKGQLATLFDAIPDFEATVGDAVAVGETVAMRVTLVWELSGIEPTDESFEVRNVVFTRIEDREIAERWVLPDVLGLFQRVGVVESPVGRDRAVSRARRQRGPSGRRNFSGGAPTRPR